MNKKYMIVRFYKDSSAEIVLQDLSIEHARAWVSAGAETKDFIEKIREQPEQQIGG
jgi:hypothetical protein